jgi:[ribosomal protein S18]-alanine N-acetyltransferase
VQIRPLISPDIEGILFIQGECPEIAQWTMWDYDRVARGEMAGWVCEDQARVLGFIVGRRIGSDLEILNFAVRPDDRRRGIGGELLGAALEWGKSFGAAEAMLEVRASNLAAMRFYERYNFEVTGRRPRYYTAPIEDALLLSARLSPRAASNRE